MLFPIATLNRKTVGGRGRGSGRGVTLRSCSCQRCCFRSTKSRGKQWKICHKLITFCNLKMNAVGPAVCAWVCVCVVGVHVHMCLPVCACVSVHHVCYSCYMYVCAISLLALLVIMLGLCHFVLVARVRFTDLFLWHLLVIMFSTGDHPTLTHPLLHTHAYLAHTPSCLCSAFLSVYVCVCVCPAGSSTCCRHHPLTDGRTFSTLAHAAQREIILIRAPPPPLLRAHLLF